MNETKTKRTARRIKAFGEEYVVHDECVDGFVVHDIHPAGHIHELLIFREDAEILIEA